MDPYRPQLHGQQYQQPQPQYQQQPQYSQQPQHAQQQTQYQQQPNNAQQYQHGQQQCGGQLVQQPYNATPAMYQQPYSATPAVYQHTPQQYPPNQQPPQGQQQTAASTTTTTTETVVETRRRRQKARAPSPEVSPPMHAHAQHSLDLSVLRIDEPEPTPDYSALKQAPPTTDYSALKQNAPPPAPAPVQSTTTQSSTTTTKTSKGSNKVKGKAKPPPDFSALKRNAPPPEPAQAAPASASITMQTSTSTTRREIGGKARQNAAAQGHAALRAFDIRVNEMLIMYSESACPAGYAYFRGADGYLCGGGHHHISHDEVDAMLAGERPHGPEIEQVNNFTPGAPPLSGFPALQPGLLAGRAVCPPVESLGLGLPLEAEYNDHLDHFTARDGCTCGENSFGPRGIVILTKNSKKVYGLLDLARALGEKRRRG